MAGRRCAEWRFPTEKQERAEATARKIAQATAPAPAPTAGTSDRLPEEYWDALLSDPRTRPKPGIPIQNRRLSEIPRHLLRVSCRRCDRIVEIQTADARRLYGDHAVWKDVGIKLLDNGCHERAGNRDSDGCWPSFE